MAKSLRALNCESHRAVFHFNPKTFDLPAFRALSQLDEDDPVHVQVSANTQRGKTAEHGHIEVDVYSNRSTLTISLHRSRVEFDEDDGDRELTLRERLKELAAFFDDPNFTGTTISSFRFPKKYNSKLILGYPAFVDSGFPYSAVVSGTELTFKPDGPATRAFVSNMAGNVYIVITGSHTIDLSSFDPLSMVRKDWVAAFSLVEENEL